MHHSCNGTGRRRSRALIPAWIIKDSPVHSEPVGYGSYHFVLVDVGPCPGCRDCVDIAEELGGEG